MFAADTTITASGRSINEAELAINHDLEQVRQWLWANRLPLL